MKTPRIANAVGHIDDDLITAAAESKKKPKRNPWLNMGLVAACLVVLIIAGAVILPSLIRGNTSDPEENHGRYKNVNIIAEQSAIVWPWELLAVNEKYTQIEIDGVEYSCSGRAVSNALTANSIGTYTALGRDDITGEKYTADFKVYQLKDVDQSQFVAVEMEGIFYVFKNSKYAPPATLGDLLDKLDISKVVELNRFAENGDDSDKQHYQLNSDDKIWEILSNCRQAAFVDSKQWFASDRAYLSFTVTSETLGIYKRAMYISTDGYLWTNMFDWAYVFDIGEDAAQKIIGDAKENSEKTSYEPFRNAITGKIVEITDEYVLIDDSILCKDPSDGITYKLLINDIKLSRYVTYGVIRIGETVQISYEGDIDEQNNNMISYAVSILKASISDGDVLIPE